MNNNQINILEQLNKLLENNKEKQGLSLRNGCIVNISENKIIIAFNYNFHLEIFNKNKHIVEKCLFEIFNKKMMVEFINFNEAINIGYELALKERDRREEKERERITMIEKMNKEEMIKRDKIEKEEAKINIEKRIKRIIPVKFYNSKLKNSLKIIQDYFFQEKYKEKGLFLFGGFGVGKTYNICSLTKNLLLKDIDVYMCNLPRLLNIIRNNFSKDKTDKKENYIEDLIDVDILVIDDIGAEKPSEWVIETIYYLINSRYENMKTTIFTSNLSLDKLSDRIGDRIVSRISEMCDIYEIKGSDRRIIKK